MTFGKKVGVLAGAAALTTGIGMVSTFEQINGIVLLGILFIDVCIIVKTKLQWGSIYQIMFFVFLVLMSLYSKSFAYIGFGVAQLYVTEMVAAVFVFAFILQPGGIKLEGAFPYLFAFFCIIGLAQLLRGLEYEFEGLRDSVIVFYSIFIPISMFAVRNKRDFTLLSYFFYPAAVINPFYSAINLIKGNFFDGYRIVGPNRLLGIISFLFVLVFYEYFKNKKVAYAVAAANLISCIMTVHRSTWFGIIAALGVFIAVSTRHKGLMVLNIKKIMLVMLISIPLIFMLEAVWAGMGSQSGINFLKYKMDFSSEGTAVARIALWERALSRFMESPVTGIGFGPDIIKKYSVRNVPSTDPHNSLLAMLVRVGVSGFAAFVFLLVYVYRCAFIILKNSNDRYIMQMTLFSLSFHTCMVVYSFFSVTLEGPQDGIFFWIPLGLILNCFTWHNRLNKLVAPGS